MAKLIKTCLWFVAVLLLSAPADAQRVAPNPSASDESRSSAVPSGDGKHPDDAFTSGWRICNKSASPKVWVAYSFIENDDWITRGWRVIEQNRCEVFQTKKTNRYAYYYASDFDGSEWTGDLDICAHPDDKFDYSGNMDVCDDGYKVFPFFKIDMDGVSHMTRDLVN